MRARLTVLIPAVRERVMIEGRDGVFLVVSVDAANCVADLIPVADFGTVEEDVPLASLRRIPNSA
jgi:hypothetical protein